MGKFESLKDLVKKNKKNSCSSSSSPSQDTQKTHAEGSKTSDNPSVRDEIALPNENLQIIPKRMPSPTNQTPTESSQKYTTAISSPSRTAYSDDQGISNQSSSCSSGITIDVHAKKGCSTCAGRGRVSFRPNQLPPNMRGIDPQKNRIIFKEFCECVLRRSNRVAQQMKLPDGTPFNINIIEPPK